ncbi:MAG: hydrogenase iron-sulfur subunit [Armatimonadota bacterium]|nr:MAG: hydrogenase iron-sulfur subunit [Armatimonadota bacterium]
MSAVEEKTEGPAPAQASDGRDQGPRLLAFLCRWCSYAGADLAGGGRLQYPANVRILRVPCSARVDPAFVLRAFRLGMDGVLVAGCHPGDCHYSEGNFYTRRRMAIFTPWLEYLGIHPKRFRLEWVSASEGHRFAEVIREMVADLEELQRLGELPAAPAEISPRDAAPTSEHG